MRACDNTPDGLEWPNGLAPHADFGHQAAAKQADTAAPLGQVPHAAESPTLSQTLLEPLRRLLAQGGPLRLYGKGRLGGLFPSDTAAARRTLEQLTRFGLLEVIESPKEIPHCRLTAHGREVLFAQQDPTVLLEDLVRVTEAELAALKVLEETWRERRLRLEQQSRDVTRLLTHLRGRAVPAQTWTLETAIEQALHELADPGSGFEADTSLADLYARLAGKAAASGPRRALAIHRLATAPSVGAFHDALRHLHATGCLVLAPWTGPLYQLPQPELALLIGHEVLYYVRRCRSEVA